MTRHTVKESLTAALADAMAADETVIVMGEDVAGGHGTDGQVGGVGGGFGVTAGLYQRFGAARVIDTPISESAFLGAAVGAAMTGLRPVVEIMFADFMGVCFDPLMNQAAKIRAISGGKARCPLTIRMAYGAGDSSSAHHSQALHTLLAQIPGLNIALPATPDDAHALLTAAIAEDDPVIVMEHKLLYDNDGPGFDTELPFGQARVWRQGQDITVAASGRLLHLASEGADRVAEAGIGVELIDLRTIRPLDLTTIKDSVARTRRLLVLDEAPAPNALVGELAREIGRTLPGAMVRGLTPPAATVPFAPALEAAFLPGRDDIRDTIKAMVGR